MHNLKKRLAHIQLSDSQKKKLKINIKQQAKKKHSLVPIILPAIVLLSIFFIVLHIGANGDATHLSSSGSVTGNDSQASKLHLSTPVLLWNIVNSVLVLLTYRLFKRNLQTVTRWQQNERMQEWHAFLHRLVIPRLLLLAGIGLLWMGAILFAHALWFAQMCFTILLIVCLTVWEFYSTRDRQWSTCPHCGEKLTRMQIFRKSFVPFRERCDYCKALIYVNAKDHQNKIIIYMLPLCSLSLHNLFGLHLILVFFFMISSVFAIYYFILPYMLTFSDKEEKQW